MTAKKHRKSAYVPRLLVRTAIAGVVVPACAMACGSSGSVPATDAATDSVFLGVAGDAYPGAGDAYASPSDAPPDVTFSVADAFFGGVADVGYRESGFGGVADAGYRESGAPDANPDGGSDARPDSRFFGVAAVAYPAYEAGNG